MRWEVEQKFAVTDVLAMKTKLVELGVEFELPVEQTDRYFNHPARDFAQTDEAFRLRRSGNLNFVTYKGPKIDAATKTRQELELPLPAGPRVFEEFAALFVALGFLPVGVVHKTRIPGSLQREGHRVAVALDEVERVGSYLELEIVVDNSGLRAAKEVLTALAQQLKLGVSERRSYLELLLKNDPK